MISNPTIRISLRSSRVFIVSVIRRTAVTAEIRKSAIICFDEASSINFRSSIDYGLGVLNTALRYRLHRWNLLRHDILE
jgi:hypothetical protein